VLTENLSPSWTNYYNNIEVMRNSSVVIFFEKLSVQSIILYCLKSLGKKNQPRLCVTSIVYIDTSKSFNTIFFPLFALVGFNIQQLKFKMMDIKDKNGELVRIRIPRVDLFALQKEIIESREYLSIKNESWTQNHLIDYINRGLVDAGAMNSLSVTRMLFLIEVVAWYIEKRACQSVIFVVKERPWLSIYKSIAGKKDIDLVSVNIIDLSKNSFLDLVRDNIWLYKIARNYKYRKSFTPPLSNDCSKSMLYVDGRGDLDLSNSGEHTDFFWLLNSNFPKNSVLYECESESEYKYLTEYGLCVTGKSTDLKIYFKKKFTTPELSVSKFSKEKKVIQGELNSYTNDRISWSNYFNKHNVKIYLSWFKYTKNHIAISDAINDVGGISVIWQMAFDGTAVIELQTIADIVFMYSRFSNEIELQVNSKIAYKVITGYPKDYIAPLLRERAKELRNKMEENGAKKIVFAIDENSGNDSRWHTGHELQRENYRYILEKVLEVTWLGVIFKPKTAKTLYQRLGPVTELLEKAIKTGRCFIYDESGRHTTKEQPLLAALSADVCIHGHLSSGTAALECALENIPTLLIDREGILVSKLNELPEGKVVFKDWPSTIDAVMDHFNTPVGIDGFGDWSSVIDDLDPFRDGKAAYRMGTYLHWLLQGYEKGLDKYQIMFDAAERYKKEWGEDKVIYG